MVNAIVRRVDRCSVSIRPYLPSRFEIGISSAARPEGCCSSPAGSRSVFLRQPGLKVDVSPSMVELVISLASLKVVVSPAEVCVGSCFPSEVPKWIGFSGGHPQ